MRRQAMEPSPSPPVVLVRRMVVVCLNSLSLHLSVRPSSNGVVGGVAEDDVPRHLPVACGPRYASAAFESFEVQEFSDVATTSPLGTSVGTSTTGTIATVVTGYDCPSRHESTELQRGVRDRHVLGIGCRHLQTGELNLEGKRPPRGLPDKHPTVA